MATLWGGGGRSVIYLHTIDGFKDIDIKNNHINIIKTTATTIYRVDYSLLYILYIVNIVI